MVGSLLVRITSNFGFHHSYLRTTVSHIASNTSPLYALVFCNEYAKGYPCYLSAQISLLHQKLCKRIRPLQEPKTTRVEPLLARMSSITLLPFLTFMIKNISFKGVNDSSPKYLSRYLILFLKSSQEFQYLLPFNKLKKYSSILTNSF